MDITNAVLVVEDDAGIRHSLFHSLSALGFAVGAASSGEEALSRLRMARYEAVLLDINMPGIGGKETCKRISSGFPSIPIIMLTVRDDEADIVELLDAGAADYIIKPFRIGELAARIRAVIRRFEQMPDDHKSLYVAGDITVDHNLRRVEKRGSEIHLTPQEYKTLRYMVINADHVLDHQQLLKAIWGPEYGSEREYLRVVINQLRKKIEDDPSNPSYLVTVSHVGYCFKSEK